MPPVAEQTQVQKDWTPEDFLDLPDSVGYELVDGQLVERNVSEESSGVAIQIAYLLKTEVAKTGEELRVYGADLGYNCFPDMPKNYRRADVSVVRKSRLEAWDNPGMMPIAADLVVEVLSPNDHVYQMNKKVELYLKNGFPLIWVVDPEIKIVYVHRADGSVTKLHEKDEISGESALPTFRCHVAEFFKI